MGTKIISGTAPTVIAKSGDASMEGINRWGEKAYFEHTDIPKEATFHDNEVTMTRTYYWWEIEL